MTINKYVNRLKQIDQLIRQQRTGSPKELAEKLSLSERQIYNSIDELRDYGVPVDYCRIRKTYFYSQPVEFNISFNFVNLTTRETREIAGGQNYFHLLTSLQYNCSGPKYL